MSATPTLVTREVLDNDPNFTPGHLFNPTLDQPVYVVTWPEHVHFHKYNGDATYHGFDSVTEALAVWPEADVDYQSIDRLGPLARDRWLVMRAKPGPLPGTILVGRTPHPRDGEVGDVIRFNATGIESLYLGGAVRSLPHDWRKTPGAVEF
ncbi:MAG: hypothetical protein GHCLOJNM_02845 [bacterium]|nr:hypothetical protein [bacterium]